MVNEGPDKPNVPVVEPIPAADQSSGVLDPPSSSPNSSAAADSNVPTLAKSGTITSSSSVDTPSLKVDAPPSNAGAPPSNAGAPPSNADAPLSDADAPSSNAMAPSSNADAPSAKIDAPSSKIPVYSSSASLIIADSGTAVSSNLPSERITTSTHTAEPVADGLIWSKNPALDGNDRPAYPLPTKEAAPDSSEITALPTGSVNVNSPTTAPIQTPSTPDSTIPAPLTTQSDSPGGTISSPATEAPGRTPPSQDATAKLKEACDTSSTFVPDVGDPSNVNPSSSSPDADAVPPSAPANAAINAKNPFAAAIDQPLPQWIVDLKEFVVERIANKEVTVCLDLLERFERQLGFARSEVRLRWSVQVPFSTLI